MTHGEAIRLTRQLSGDPSSMIAAAINEWDAPRSREWLLLADLYDLTHQIASPKRVTAYPRPWPSREMYRTSPAANVTQAQIVAALREAGHTAPLPESR